MKKSTVVLSAILCMGSAHLGMAQPDQSPYSVALVQSKEDFKGKNYEAAEKDAQKLLVLADSPEETQSALLILAETFYSRKMYEQARVQWNKTLTVGKDDDDDSLHPIAHLGLARSYTAQGNFDKSIPEYQAVIDSFNQKDVKGLSAIFSLALANAYYNTQQFDLAQQQLKQVIESGPAYPVFRMVALTRDAEIDVTQRRFKKSVTKFQQVLDILDTKDFKELNSTSPSGIKGFVQRQIATANNLMAAGWGEGDINSGIEILFAPNTEFDGKLDAFSRLFVDDLVVDGIIIEVL